MGARSFPIRPLSRPLAPAHGPECIPYIPPYTTYASSPGFTDVLRAIIRCCHWVHGKPFHATLFDDLSAKAPGDYG